MSKRPIPERMIITIDTDIDEARGFAALDVHVNEQDGLTANGFTMVWRGPVSSSGHRMSPERLDGLVRDELRRLVALTVGAWLAGVDNRNHGEMVDENGALIGVEGS